MFACYFVSKHARGHGIVVVVVALYSLTLHYYHVVDFLHCPVGIILPIFAKFCCCIIILFALLFCLLLVCQSAGSVAALIHYFAATDFSFCLFALLVAVLPCFLS